MQATLWECVGTPVEIPANVLVDAFAPIKSKGTLSEVLTPLRSRSSKGYKIFVSLHLPSYAHIMRIMEVCP